MEHKKAPTGRPPSPVDGSRLKSLRKDARLTQMGLANAVYKLAGRPVPDDATLKSAAQRWEANNAVDAKLLPFLATVLRTTVGVLQGESPEPAPSISEQLKACIHQQMSRGATAELSEALARFSDEDSQEGALAESLASRLEAAQLTNAGDEFKYLGLLTGLSHSELRRPVSEKGHWVFIASGIPGAERHEILCGVSAVTHEVRLEMSQYLQNCHESDARVRFAEDNHWFRISIERPHRTGGSRHFQFSRCQADEKGLQWCSATWLDRFFIDWLVEDARAQANFVVGFDVAIEPQALRNLQLVVMRPEDASSSRPTVESPSADNSAEGPHELPVFVKSLELDDFLSDRLEAFSREGNGHYVALNWLTADVWPRLFPHLAPWPLEYWQWRPCAGSIRLDLNLPPALLRQAIKNGFTPRFGPVLSIELHEKLPDGSLKRAPWSARSIETAQARLEGMKSQYQNQYEQYLAASRLAS